LIFEVLSGLAMVAHRLAQEDSGYKWWQRRREDEKQKPPFSNWRQTGMEEIAVTKVT
jgi:hypothetical protein